MKKWILLSMTLVLTSLTATAQDDMYFASSKKMKAEREAAQKAREAYERTYYCGSQRSVDDYNRMGSSYQMLPKDTGDVITFDAVEGVYPDSVADYQLTKQMTRFDDYVPSIAYWEGYKAGQRDSWGWHSPWYYSSLYPWYDPWYYDPWYAGWYDPWYYDYGWRRYGWYAGYGGWYGGWYGYYGYGNPYYYSSYTSPTTIRHGSVYTSRTGTQSHGRIVENNHRSTIYSSTANGRGVGAGRSTTGGVRSAGITGGRSNTGSRTTVPVRTNTTVNTSIGNGNTRSTSGSVYSGGGNRSAGSSVGGGGGSFGGGGGRSGGGSVGGGRSTSGGRR